MLIVLSPSVRAARQNKPPFD